MHGNNDEDNEMAQAAAYAAAAADGMAVVVDQAVSLKVVSIEMVYFGGIISLSIIDIRGMGI